MKQLSKPNVLESHETGVTHIMLLHPIIAHAEFQPVMGSAKLLSPME